MTAASGCSGGRSRKDGSGADLLKQGEALLKQGKVLKAEKVFRLAIKKAPRNLDAWRALARALSAGGRIREAAQTLSDGLKKADAGHPHRYEALTELAGTLARQGKHNQAVSVYDRARKLKPERAEAYFKLADLYVGYRQHDVARALYKKFLELKRGKTLYPEIMARWAAMEQTAGRNEAAVKLLERALQSGAARNDLAARIRLQLGRALMDLNRYTEALVHLEKAAALEPRNGRAHADLGETLAALGRCRNALAPLRRAVKLLKDNPRPAALLATCLSSTGKKAHSDEAYAMALRASALDPDNRELALLLARLHLERGLTKPALDLLDRVRGKTDARPDPVYLRLRGRVLMAMGRPKQAGEAFASALAINPKDHEAFRWRALAARRAGAYRRAEQDLAEVLRRNPQDYQALVNLGIAREHLKRRARARAALIKAAKLEPKRQEAWVYLGWLDMRTGRMKKAETFVQKALTLGGPHRIHALDVLAQIRTLQGRIMEAVRTLRKAASIARTPAEKKYIRRFLSKLERRLKSKPAPRLKSKPAPHLKSKPAPRLKSKPAPRLKSRPGP